MWEGFFRPSKLNLIIRHACEQQGGEALNRQNHISVTEQRIQNPPSLRVNEGLSSAMGQDEIH